jgi:hypothetical protein
MGFVIFLRQGEGGRVVLKSWRLVRSLSSTAGICKSVILFDRTTNVHFTLPFPYQKRDKS